MTTVFIISAPSGSGKSTLVGRLMANVPGLMFSVSYTTRKARGAESEGQNYHFISRPEFEAMIARGEFLEWAEVFGNYYGTHRRVLEQAHAQGKGLVLDIDVQGRSPVEMPDTASGNRFHPASFTRGSGTTAPRARRRPRRGNRAASA